MNWIKYSGVWCGLVLNPYHWRFKWAHDNEAVFENCLYVGPFWIRVIIDNAERY